MTKEEAKILVCDSGKRLLKEGFVARTWGNVSVRISGTQMVITPSGRRYEELDANDMVVVNYHDLSFEGDIKPSSELKLHCEIYKRRPDANAVMHTHQMYASIIAAAQQDVPLSVGTHRDILGCEIVKAAPYALPNTKKITVATADALGNANAALMSNHGVVCCGSALDDVFEKCSILESACQLYLEHSAEPVTE
ncbi:MAG: class II aldolase/adducin family protein [Bacteroidetes bacterium]|nr:class II aldolase/adducin family protein [Bacteroidota bacterium]